MLRSYRNEHFPSSCFEVSSEQKCNSCRAASLLRIFARKHLPEIIVSGHFSFLVFEKVSNCFISEAISR